MVARTGLSIGYIKHYNHVCSSPLVSLIKISNHPSGAIFATDAYHPKGLLKGNHKIILLYNVQRRD
jgi:hypothetical protein